MVRKQPIRIYIKKVIEALREGPKTWTELKNLGIPEKTLQRALQDYLMYWGLVRKNQRHYFWYEDIQVFNSDREYQLAIEHSRKLIPGLEGIILEFQSKLFKALDFLYRTDEYAEKMRLKDFAKQHLKTGYPQIYKKLTTLKQPLNKQEKTELFKEVAGEIEMIKLKVVVGEPLKGRCQLCPKVRVREEGRP